MRRLIAGIIAMGAINLIVPSHTLEKQELPISIIESEDSMESELLKLQISCDKLVTKLDSLP
jgi:hypothetical protein